jgi:hypothetical protein
VVAQGCGQGPEVAVDRGCGAGAAFAVGADCGAFFACGGVSPCTPSSFEALMMGVYCGVVGTEPVDVLCIRRLSENNFAKLFSESLWMHKTSAGSAPTKVMSSAVR